MNLVDPNVALVELIAAALGPLRERLVFVGGCATGLLITDRARPPVRPTQDVDLVAEVASLGDYYRLTDELRTAGFIEHQGDVICRWQFGNLLVDVMPTDESILGFSNRWYLRAVAEARDQSLPSGLNIRLITAPLLVATKIEAFHGRGAGDFAMSHDIEDIINLVDGRPELPDEIANTQADLRAYVMDQVDELLAQRPFVDAIPWHIAPQVQAEGRDQIVIDRLRKIAGL